MRSRVALIGLVLAASSVLAVESRSSPDVQDHTVSRVSANGLSAPTITVENSTVDSMFNLALRDASQYVDAVQAAMVVDTSGGEVRIAMVPERAPSRTPVMVRAPDVPSFLVDSGYTAYLRSTPRSPRNRHWHAQLGSKTIGAGTG